jgi:hypothetical protein
MQISMGPIAQSSLDPSTKEKLENIRKRVIQTLWAAGLYSAPPALVEAVESALITLAGAGQNDPDALERYACSRAGNYLTTRLRC